MLKKARVNISTELDFYDRIKKEASSFEDVLKYIGLWRLSYE